MDAPGGAVLMFAGLLTLPVAIGLWALRRSLLPALAIGPVLAAAVIIEARRIGDTITQPDVVAIFTACILGTVSAVAPVAYVRWGRRVFPETERELAGR